MSTLPAEIKEEILTALVESCGDEDPAYVWTQLRNLSHFQRRRIENRFESFWLPKLSITVYHGVWYSFDYAYVGPHASLTEGIATYKQVPGRDGAFSKETEDLLKASTYERLNAPNPELILRFGEGFGDTGELRGGYIINDSELPGLEASEDGLVLRFDWRAALDALFREEMLLRKFRDEMMDAAMRDSRQLPSVRDDPRAQNRYLIKCLSLEIQMASRAAVRRHRRARADLNGPYVPMFKLASQRLHCQKPDEPTPATLENRVSDPDIFEIVQSEESVVLCLPEWRELNNNALLELYAEEFGWSSCKWHDRRDDVDYQQERASFWKSKDQNEVLDLNRLRNRRRYDPMD
ncbi:uncharacterized protein N0V89_009381 [Didymosphaeria variabile]|uniref:Uncharacterized protein n=1 Tax=Didymosphaeria variabile TaxID=1932322 RepID=A0A9W8XF09_9PLEO|nr:uncharacterized protein N0V89_009381 [Didymosphaeria variabile]KAJ4348009.1 hypothetical protein N0V89_009381 [Didymosphaeria variabile]